MPINMNFIKKITKHFSIINSTIAVDLDKRFGKAFMTRRQELLPPILIADKRS